MPVPVRCRASFQRASLASEARWLALYVAPHTLHVACQSSWRTVGMQHRDATCNMQQRGLCAASQVGAAACPAGPFECRRVHRLAYALLHWSMSTYARLYVRHRHFEACVHACMCSLV
jgi:hypothetical protein